MAYRGAIDHVERHRFERRSSQLAVSNNIEVCEASLPLQQAQQAVKKRCGDGLTTYRQDEDRRASWRLLHDCCRVCKNGHEYSFHENTQFIVNLAPGFEALHLKEVLTRFRLFRDSRCIKVW